MVSGWGNCADKNRTIKFITRSLNASKRLTQESVVGVGLEQFLRSVHVESEGQEDLDVWLILEQCTIDILGILELAYTDGIVTLYVTLGIQRVQNLVFFSGEEFCCAGEEDLATFWQLMGKPWIRMVWNDVSNDSVLCNF